MSKNAELSQELSIAMKEWLLPSMLCSSKPTSFSYFTNERFLLNEIKKCTFQLVDSRSKWSSHSMWWLYRKVLIASILISSFDINISITFFSSWVHNEWSHFWMARWGTSTSGWRTHFASIPVERRKRFAILH